MYPPIIRDKERRSWNKFATDLMVELLKRPENMIGFHPEGTRNRDPDPYSLLRAQPGCGELIYRARPNVVPVFLQGFPSRFWVLLRQNWNKSQASEPVVHMVMGEPMDFSEELEKEANMKTYLRISRKAMHRIEELSRQEKEIRAGFKGQTAEAVL
jgi:1-acyl-sn-glycerol-3-phosphate acyltransferase